MTLASLKEAEALVALEVGCDPMVATAGTGWRTTDLSPGNKLCTLGHSGLVGWGRVRRTAVECSCFIGVHGSKGQEWWVGTVTLALSYPALLFLGSHICGHPSGPSQDPAFILTSLLFTPQPFSLILFSFLSIHSTLRFFTFAHLHALLCSGVYTLTLPESPNTLTLWSINRLSGILFSSCHHILTLSGSYKHCYVAPQF